MKLWILISRGGRLEKDMYCGYDLKFLSEGCFDDYDFADPFYEKGLIRFSKYKEQIETTLNNFAINEGILDGSAIQKNWFPQIKADIFISHAHSDSRTAIIFSEILQNCFNLTSFIDSCVWGYANDLLRLIDKKYCYNYDDHTYDYKKRNFSTSHVHSMLSTALMMMIDNCECIFFLDTPNSVTAKGVIDRTQSPWIYSEINISRLIKRKFSRHQRKLQEFMLKSSVEASKRIEYELDKSHFIELTEEDFSKWLDQKNERIHSLDILYKIDTDKKTKNNRGVIYG
jgi:hypothetical protein